MVRGVRTSTHCSIIFGVWQRRMFIPMEVLRSGNHNSVYQRLRYSRATSSAGYVFRKHWFGPKPDELREGTEEFECAQFLDDLGEVRFWVRNLARKPSSFRLQTSRDWFYPDFVCQLTDGRVLVVEYKGGNADVGWYAMPDSQEKRDVGAVWEGRSGGKCLFIMPPGKDFAAIVRKVAS
jgi:type III restriction enzyme